MTIDPEELKRRRLEKQQQRQSDQKKMKIRLIVAGAVVLLCTILILSLTLGSCSPSKPQPSAPQETTEETQPNTTVIHLAAAGDLNVTQAVVNAGGSAYDYTAALMDVAHLLGDADVTLMNFEGNLYGAPYGSDRSAPQNLIQSLARAGVDLLQLANSYSIYKGMDGLESTLSGIRLAGLTPLGAYATAAEAKESGGYIIRNIGGVRIAFVAFTKGMDGMALPAGNEGCVNLLYTDYSTDYQKVDTEGITKILSAISKEKPDLTVAMLHWGSEYNDTISESQESIRGLMQEKGVDVILGTHSHYVQKMDFDPEAGTFVAYSLGDFMGDAQRAGSEYSVILDLEITKHNETGETKVTGYHYTPIFTVAEQDKPLKVVRIADAMAAYDAGYIDKISQEIYEDMAYALERIEARVNGK